MLPGCDPAQPTACAATNTTCVASAATVTQPGAGPASVCMSPADRMVDEVYKAVARATTTVDITSLEPMDGRFMLGFRNAVTYLAHTGRSITIRFLYGNIPFHTTRGSVEDTIEGLVRDAIHVSGSKLTVYAGYLRSGTTVVSGWNHSKTIIADASRILVGGENWISVDYLQANPVFDLNMKLQGQVAADATGFVNLLWSDLCAHNGFHVRRKSAMYSAVSAGVGKFKVTEGACLTTVAPTVSSGGGNVNTMAVGRLGEIDDPGGAQSTAALIALIRAAKNDVWLSQQNIEGPNSRWPDDVLHALADQVIAGRNVHIVQSSDNAGNSISGYSNGTLTALADKLKSTVKGRKGAPKDGDDLKKLLCKRLYLAQIRFTDGVNSYPGNKGIGNHAKTVAADDSTFYIGSQNLYPPNKNMEFGIIVSDKPTFATWKASYWDQLWTYSKQSAISGGSPSNCYYQK
jgi:phosphatidylserine/phosphatidylglycerophosphate/cardiolipin synthase-like enzyme